MTELCSDLAATYPEIKALALQAVLDNWEMVRDSDEMKTLQAEVKEGVLEKRKVTLLFELFSKLKPAGAA
ncbi:uncharacterized protein JCM15063_006412 [Sporobolomyces koalae]|uniref:uncharacterized protein n=1 Tax=Sporobolomyces koalae TaxID=500713 RepID=UPI00316FE376